MTVGSGLFDNQRAAKPHLVRGTGGIAGEISDLRRDIDDELGPLASMAVEEFIDPAAVDIDAIVVALATVAAAVTVDGAGLDGAVGAAVMDPPRNITFDTSGGTPADAPATATVNGTDDNGAPQTEVVTLAQTAAQAVGVLAFRTVTSVVYPAADGTDAFVAVGFGEIFGLGEPIKERAGLSDLIREIEAGSLVTTGTIVDAATSGPNGTYEPATVADGANDYAVYYEWDPTA